MNAKLRIYMLMLGLIIILAVWTFQVKLEVVQSEVTALEERVHSLETDVYIEAPELSMEDDSSVE
jgi:hypothetical protein